LRGAPFARPDRRQFKGSRRHVSDGVVIGNLDLRFPVIISTFDRFLGIQVSHEVISELCAILQGVISNRPIMFLAAEKVGRESSLECMIIAIDTLLLGPYLAHHLVDPVMQLAAALSRHYIL
jgi:hypothetical protein